MTDTLTTSTCLVHLSARSIPSEFITSSLSIISSILDVRSIRSSCIGLPQFSEFHFAFISHSSRIQLLKFCIVPMRLSFISVGITLCQFVSS